MSLKRKKHIIVFIILFILISFTITIYIFNILSSRILEYSKSYIKAEGDKIFKDASKKINTYDKNNLIRVIRNDNSEIVMIDFDIKKTNKILDTLVNNIDLKLDNIDKNNYKVYVPLGIVSNNSIISNMGPKVPIKINVIGSSYGNVKTKVREYGINSVLLEIYVEVRMNLEYNLALKKVEEKCNYTSLIASKVISGKIPDYYEGVERSASSAINIPFRE